MLPDRSSITCSRRIEFDAAHRVMRHESKCRHLHGHRYRVDITATALDDLDDIGRVIDFSVLKSIVGGWIDEQWDHGAILNDQDEALIEYCLDNNSKCFLLPNSENPTAEVMAAYLLEISNRLLADAGSPVLITHIRLYETPNCWADVHVDSVAAVAWRA